MRGNWGSKDVSQRMRLAPQNPTEAFRIDPMIPRDLVTMADVLQHEDAWERSFE